MNWMHSCRKVAELLSQRLDEPLGPLDRMRLRVHLSMCDNCRQVERQIDRVHALTAELFSAGPGSDDGPAAPEPGPRPPGRPG